MLSMPIPRKALYEKNLVYTGKNLPSSGHEVLSIQFSEQNQTMNGFYKKLASDYPPILAQYSVAISVLMRISLGRRVAEERLVYNQKGQIIGTVSLQLPKYIPMATYHDTLPHDTELKEIVSPTTKILLKHNIAELLVAIWRNKGDDRHPKNLSVFGLIDFDMVLWNITAYMKGLRFIDGDNFKGPPEVSLALHKKDIDNFPDLDNRVHWPSNPSPKNKNFFKTYASYEAFQDLAKNPILKDDEDSISFQEQLFEALLKELITFDEQMLESQLKDYFGNSILDYSKFDPQKLQTLRSVHPEFFKKGSKPPYFVSHIMAVFQTEHQKFYNLVVDYTGCDKNKYGVPVVSFQQFLQRNPSAIDNILTWVEQEGHINGVYNIEVMQKRYHQVWRDSNRIQFMIYFAEIQNAMNELFEGNFLSKKSEESLWDSSIQEINKLLSSWVTSARPINDICSGLQSDIEKLIKLSEQYFLLPSHELTVECNQYFYLKSLDIIRGAQKKVESDKSKLMSGLALSLSSLYDFVSTLDFKMHQATLIPSQDGSDLKKLLEKFPFRYDDDSVVNQCLFALLDWAKEQESKGILSSKIMRVIEKDYRPRRINVFAKRTREEELQPYLDAPIFSGANRLAMILSEGGVKSTSLNTCLIKAFLPEMLQDNRASLKSHFLAARLAIESNKFDWELYAQKAKEFFSSDGKFLHIRTTDAATRLASLIMHMAVECCTYAEVNTAARKSIERYKPNTYNLFHSKKREPEINILLKGIGKQRMKESEKVRLILKALFKKGGHKANSFNTYFYQELLCLLKKKIEEKRELELFFEGVTLVKQIQCPLQFPGDEKYVKAMSDFMRNSCQKEGEDVTQQVGYF